MSVVLMALLLAMLTGAFLVWALWPDAPRNAGTLTVRLALAAGLGLGLSSCATYMVMLFAGPARGAIMLVDVVLLVVLGAAFGIVLLRRKDVADDAPAGPARNVRLARILLVGFCLVLACGLVTFIQLSTLRRHGDWDAWAFWNLRAKHLVEYDLHQWRLAFTMDKGLMGYHPDYPPLLPLSVVRCWQWTSSETTLAPIFIAGTFTFASIALLVGTLRAAGAPVRGWMAGIVLAGTPFYILQGASQYADHALAFFILAALALLVLHDLAKGESPGLLVLAGVACGLAGFTKNEGVLFVAVLTVVWVFFGVVRSPRATRFNRLLAFAAGLVPVLLLLVHFKLTVSPDTSQIDMMKPGSVSEKILSPARYWQIARAFIDQMFVVNKWNVFWPVLPLLGLLIGFGTPDGCRTSVRVCIVAVALMMLGYFAFYVVTPHELTWHLTSSLDRLFLHLWPAAIFAFCLVIRSPGGAADETAPSSPSRGK